MGRPAQERIFGDRPRRRAAASAVVGLLVACDARDGSRTQETSPPEAEPSATGERCGARTVELHRPPPHPLLFGPAPTVSSQGEASGRFVVARWYDARIHARPDPASPVVGFVRRGQRARVRRGARGTGCPADMWYELADGGYACAAREFREGHVEVPHPVEPRLDQPLPFDYARVVREGAPSFEQLPTEDELVDVHAALDAGEHLPATQALKGAHFVTSVEVVEHAGHRFHRTDTGRYVLAEHVERVERPLLHGEPIAYPERLPLAFVRTPEAEVHCACDDGIVACGRAHLFARFGVEARREVATHAYVVSADGHLLATEDVGIASVRAPPEEIGTDDRWIHVDLTQQTLVAYVGRRAVYATLVSSGKEKYATPTGLWRVDRKYVSTTMSGPDEDKGTYTVSEVPWTMFYDGDFALHGAYWHAEFGRVRSHGCTNLPPADARWLFAWSGPLPAGWHAASHLKGPWIYITED